MIRGDQIQQPNWFLFWFGGGGEFGVKTPKGN